LRKGFNIVLAMCLLVLLCSTGTFSKETDTIAVYVLIDVSETITEYGVEDYLDQAVKPTMYLPLKKGDYVFVAVFGMYPLKVLSSEIMYEGYETTLYADLKDSVDRILDDRQERRIFGDLSKYTIFRCATYCAIVDGFLPRSKTNLDKKNVLMLISDGIADIGAEESLWKKMPPVSEAFRQLENLPDGGEWFVITVGFPKDTLVNTDSNHYACYTEFPLDKTDLANLKKTIAGFRQEGEPPTPPPPPDPFPWKDTGDMFRDVVQVVGALASILGLYLGWRTFRRLERKLNLVLARA